ncbi:MAG: G8 domain-containing protein [Altererythrobacter sp.]|nr:G8 domain-containing protein [Altererythrobacter sp.]
MRLPSRLLLLSLVLPLSLGAGSGAYAQDSHAHDQADGGADGGVDTSPVAMRRLVWSDPAAWPGGKVPGKGDAVVIGRDMDVVLDVVPPALRSVTIDGKLSFADDRDLALETEWIYLRRGELRIGSEGKPYKHNATITLTDNVPDEDINTMGDRGILVMGGKLELHGDREHTWTKLSSTAKAGSTKIEVLDAGGWRKGDEIVLASTDFDPRQAEKRTITAIRGNAITLDKPLEYMHFGEITFGVDERGEVGLLTRNIRIQASDDAEKTYFGGHIMAMLQSDVHISGVELSRMGQDTYSRCVTVHGTNNVRVENNVTFNTVGHCFFLEDGVETGNQIVHNLGIQTKCHPDGKPCVPTNLGPFLVEGGKNFDTSGQLAKDILIPSDNNVSTFWITNPDNIYRDNVAAGSDQIGFWFALPEHPTGAFDGKEGSGDIWPRRTPVGEFKGNTAHSNFDGLMLDRGPRPDGTFATGGHIALADPTDANSAQVETVIQDFTSYKNRNGGLWARGEMDVFKNLRVADNAIGYTHASANFGRSAFTSRVVDSLFVGESANIGNPRTPQEVAYGRSLPEPQLADFPIRGYEFYDYRHDLDNVTFVNFQDNATRKTGAISYLLYTSFGMSSNNTIQRAKFVNAKPVYFPPVEHKWSNDDYGNGTYKTAVFHDLDGSVGGVPNAFILINDESTGIAIDNACEIKPSWNAAVCTGDVGRLAVGGAGGPGGPGIPGFGGAPGAGPPRGPAARPGAAPGPAGAGGPGAAFGRPAGGPPEPPVVLSRNDKHFPITGETNVRAGTEIKVITERPSVNLNVKELDSGSWVIFELPGFTSAASGTPRASLNALREASDTSYYEGNGSLWVKLVSTGDILGNGPGAGVSLQASR